MRSPHDLPLSGVKVIELATIIAAPTASRMLCAYGAEVIKVETLRGDDLRYVGSYYDTPYGDYQNPTFTVQNSNKKLVAIDLKTSEGKKVFHELLKTADVFITNLREDALQRLDLDYETIKQSYPTLIYAHLTSFGPLGPAAKAPGYDITAFWARTGCLADWPEENGVPFSPTYGFGDTATGTLLLSGILMALLGRAQNGKGTYVTTSLFASGIWNNGDGLVLSQFYRQPLNRDLLHPASMFSTVYRCKDGKWISIYASNYHGNLPKFAKAMGMEDVLQDPRYESYDKMRESGALEESVRRCQMLFLQRTALEWKEHLFAYDIACEIAANTKDLCYDEQALANEYVQQVSFDENLDVYMANPPLRFSEYSYLPYEPCGGIGHDTDNVLTALGYDAHVIEAYRSDHIIR